MQHFDRLHRLPQAASLPRAKSQSQHLCDNTHDATRPLECIHKAYITTVDLCEAGLHTWVAHIGTT